MLEFVLNFFIKKEKQFKILDFLFPPICGICGKINKNWLCSDCEKTLNRIKKNKIIKIQKNNRYNKDCVIENNIFYDKLLYIFPYKGVIRQLILKFKFKNQAYISNLFSRFIIIDEFCCRNIESYDIIIPIPMFEKKKKQRGYNQTELIVNNISKKLNIIVENNCVIKIKNTKVQSLLSGLERKENIKNAFLVNNKGKIENKNIIVFDDIFTTGETVNEVSRILKQAGARRILVLVLAKD